MNVHNTYSKVQKETISGRDLEARVLSKASAFLKRILETPAGPDRERFMSEGIRFNLRVWDVFQADWENPDCSLASNTRTDLLRLSIYVHKTSLEVLAYGAPEKINSLINIDDRLVAGLSTPVPHPAEPATA
jgi:flagellar protein FlaF